MIITWTVHCYLEVLDHYLNCRLPNSNSRSLLKLSIDKFKLLITTLTVDCQIQVVAHHLNCRLLLKTVDQHLNCRLLPRSSRSPLKLSIAKFKFSITTWTVDCQIQIVDHYLNCRFPHKTINQYLNCRLSNKSCWSPLKLSIAKFKLLLITWTVDWNLKLLITT